MFVNFGNLNSYGNNDYSLSIVVSTIEQHMYAMPYHFVLPFVYPNYSLFVMNNGQLNSIRSAPGECWVSFVNEMLNMNFPMTTIHPNLVCKKDSA